VLDVGLGGSGGWRRFGCEEELAAKETCHAKKTGERSFEIVLQSIRGFIIFFSQGIRDGERITEIRNHTPGHLTNPAQCPRERALWVVYV
jgi:hypothetical protein